MPLSGREKATILLSMIGADASSKILRYLPDELADMLATGVDRLPTPSAEAVGEVLQEFQDFVSLPRPGVKKELEDNFPELDLNEEKPEESLLPPVPQMTPKTPLEKLEFADARSFASMLLYERTQLVAFVLKILSEKKREEILLQLPGQRQEIELWMKQLSENKFNSAFNKTLVDHFAAKLS